MSDYRDFYSGRRVLVTGGLGFIGSNLCRALADLGARVPAVDSLLPANLQDFARLPNATLEVLSRAGHEVAVHEPDRVAEAIAAFMAHGPVTAASLMARALAGG